MSSIATTDRRLHLVDIENLAGGSDADPTTVMRAYRVFMEVAQPGGADHVIVGCGPLLAPIAWFQAPPGWRVVLGRGLDGADRALTAAVPVSLIVSRYREVVIGSGDTHFTSLARSLQTSGCPVTIVGPWGAISRQLVNAADQVKGVSSCRRSLRQAS